MLLISHSLIQFSTRGNLAFFAVNVVQVPKRSFLEIQFRGARLHIVIQAHVAIAESKITINEAKASGIVMMFGPSQFKYAR
jgi:hypothetical protein